MGIVSSVDKVTAPNVDIGDVLIRIDPKYFRPAEVETLLGDPTKAKEKLGWIPEYNLSSLVREMMDFDLTLLKK